MLTIDRQAKQKVYQQLYDQIRAEIETGVRRPGALMPSTRFLATQLAVSRNTVDHAYQELVAEGYLVSKPASGYHVTHHLPFVVTPTTTPLPQSTKFTYDFTESRDLMQLFPTQAWQAAELRVLQQGIDHIQPLGGDWAYRQQLVNYFARLKHLHITPEQIIVTGGFNEAANLISHLVPNFHTEGLGIAEPIAPNAREVWKVLDIPTKLFRTLDQLPDAAGYVLCPTHNFPDGFGIDAKQRRALAEQLLQTQRYLIELDTDGTLNYDGQAAPALHHFMHGQRCFYYTNFDETLGSSLCAGMLVIPTELVPTYRKLYSKLPNRNSQLQQGILAQMIQSDDLERYLRQLTVVYSNRRRLLLDRLAQTFGKHLTPIGTAAGSFVTLRFPDGIDASALIQQAATQGVGLVDPDRCWHDLKPAYPSVSFSFRQASDDTIINGVAALAHAWEQFTV